MYLYSKLKHIRITLVLCSYVPGDIRTVHSNLNSVLGCGIPSHSVCSLHHKRQLPCLYELGVMGLHNSEGHYFKFKLAMLAIKIPLIKLHLLKF